MGFHPAGRHRTKDVVLYRQGDINFIVNAEPDSFAQAFARVHGPSICAIAFRVGEAADAYARALLLGAKPFYCRNGPMELNLPAIKGIGGRHTGSTAVRVRMCPYGSITRVALKFKKKSDVIIIK